jgi:hypothetical protein
LHDDAECDVQIFRLPLLNDGGQQRGYKETWHVRGMLLADTAAELNTKIGQLKTAYIVQGKDIALLLNDGSTSTHAVDTARTAGGVFVVDGPNVPEGGGAEFAESSSFRHYEITLEATVLDTTVQFTAWAEAIGFSGGGPHDVHIPTLTGLPQKQRVYRATPFRAFQSGSAIGQFGWPVPPPPLWPAAEKIPERDIQFKSPNRAGPPGKPYYTDFEVTWRYSFEAATPLNGRPNKWPN